MTSYREQTSSWRDTRVELGIDGDCGFALLGENIQEGECEFEKINSTEPTWTLAYQIEAKLAINKAFKRLKERLGKDHMPYYISPSHPNHCS